MTPTPTDFMASMTFFNAVVDRIDEETDLR
jgi:hypothetical protein